MAHDRRVVEAAGWRAPDGGFHQDAVIQAAVAIAGFMAFLAEVGASRI